GRPRAEIAADRRHVADLRRRHRLDRLGERRILLHDGGILHERGQRDAGADAETGPGGLDLVEAADRLQVDEHVGFDDAVLHQVEERRAAGERERAGAEGLDGLFLGLRALVGEGFHGGSPYFFARAERTRRGVNGRSPTRTPTALVTALAIAAAPGMYGGSPMPMTPRSG